jgi:hypothetical protein
MDWAEFRAIFSQAHFDTKLIELNLGRFFHKRIWSPWPGRFFIIVMTVGWATGDFGQI